MSSRIIIILSTLSIMSVMFSLCVGSIFISPWQFASAATDTVHQILFNLRFPRTCSAFITGGLLAMAGVIMQALLRNPLADPYILGVSGGAAIGALLCLLAGLTGMWVTGGAWLGSLCIIMVISALSHTTYFQHSEKMLLTGIALTSGFSALISLILILANHHELHSMLFWLMGDLSFSHPPIMEGIILVIALWISLRYVYQLNVLALGPREAQALGIDVAKIQWQLYLLCGLMTAAAIALAGCIGFIGLIIPHLLRLVCGHDHRLLIPGSVLLGGSLLTLADALARSIAAPQQLPTGIIIAIIGVPTFLWLLHRQKLAY